MLSHKRLKMQIIHLMHRENSVVMSTELDSLRSIPGCERFCRLHNAEIGSGAHSDSYLIGTWDKVARTRNWLLISA
jgi:hypothetical protein